MLQLSARVVEKYSFIFYIYPYVLWRKLKRVNPSNKLLVTSGSELSEFNNSDKCLSSLKYWGTRDSLTWKIILYKSTPRTDIKWSGNKNHIGLDDFVPILGSSTKFSLWRKMS